MTLGGVAGRTGHRLQHVARSYAVLCSEAGDLDKAFVHLDRAIDARDPALVRLAVASRWDDPRTDTRFGGRLARTRLRVDTGGMMALR